ncbi:MAG: AMP-binding protein [Rhodospirillaceae bacterium]|nr:AMP-binding protein [Rhodospirillaceae bacterium]
MTGWSTAYQALTRQASLRGDAPGLRYPLSDQGRSFAQWHEEATALARGLLAIGVRPGDHVALMAEARVEWLIVETAVAAMGGVVVPLNTHYRAEEIRFALDQSRSRALILSPVFRSNAYLDMVESVRADLPRLDHAISFEPGGDLTYAELLRKGRESTATLPDVDPDKPAAILYTSGTTGFPKGALLTHRAMLMNSRLTFERLQIGPADRYTTMIPPFHCAGCCMVLLGVLQSGACHVGVPYFDPETMFQVIEGERVTGMSGVPTAYLAMLRHESRGKYDLSSLRAGSCGGADADPDVLAACAREFPMPRIANVYGQTETCTLIACPEYDDDDRGATVGRPFKEFDVRISDPATGKALPAGEIGQIEARGPMVMLGYYDRPVETAETIDEEGWLKTGDLGYLTQEGRLVIAGGRIRDLIIRGGENIYPAEVEKVLNDHPKIAEAAVFGMRDEYYGETVAAAVRVAEDTTSAEILDYCRSRMARFKLPAQIFRVERFPQTASGKIRRKELREMAAAGTLQPLG